MVYEDCSELPLYNWIKLAITGDHKWLIKSGSFDDLSEHYEKIYSEYSTLTKDVRTGQELRIKIALTTLANRIDHIKIVINMLRVKRDERLIKIMRESLGFSRLTFEDLNKDLDRAENFARNDLLKFEQKQAEYQKLMSDNKTENTEGQFYEQITILAKWLGFSIDVKQTSVMQYVNYLNALKLEVKNNNGR